MSEYILPLERLIEQFRRLPGIGQKTAVRLALSVIGDGARCEAFADALLSAKNEITECSCCHNIACGELCDICASDDRDKSIICVVEDVRAVMAFERMQSFNGVYHILGGALSPSKGISSSQLNIDDLIKRAKSDGVKEILLATNATVEGDTTAMYIARRLDGIDVSVSRLAYGIPVGADLEYADETTLRRALDGRRSI